MGKFLVFSVLCLLMYLSHGMPFIEYEQSDEVCEDDPDYADKCLEKAAIEGYCKDQEDFMRKHCPETCDFCREVTAKPPAPAVCEDDPDYADKCPEKAAIEGYCKNQEDFMRKHCPETCGFCREVTTQTPAPAECKDNPDYADKCLEHAAIDNYCKDQKDFMKENCPKTCRFC